MSFKLAKIFLSLWLIVQSKKCSRIFHYLFLFLFVNVLAYFLHFREVRVDHLELSGVAEKYVLAQVGFEFPDIEATRLFQEESLRDIGRMYCFQDDEVFQIEKNIQNDLVQNGNWRQKLPGVSFEDLVQASNTIKNTLLNVALADARTVLKVKQLNNVLQKDLVFVYIPNSLIGPLSKEFFNQIQEPDQPALHYMKQKYGDCVWHLVEDFTRQNAVREVVKNSIPLKMTKVEAGSRIISAGENVTARHLDMIQAMKKALMDQKFKITPITILGSIALASILTLMGIFYFKSLHPKLFQSPCKMGLIGVIVIITLGMAKFTEYLIINTSIADFCRYPIFVLFVTLIISILIDRGVATIVAGFVSMVLTITLAMEYKHFLIINLSTVVITVFLMKSIRKRKDIFTICWKVWLMTLPLLIATNLLENAFFNYRLLIDFATTFICVSITGILVVAILPLLEMGFGIVTDMTLMELGDSSHSLLRRLSLEAPGTYQHSLGVAVLAEEAALAIGGNSVFCRVASLYHDIGKVMHPYYFIENQFSNFNMHQLLTPVESAQLIIAHVADGVKLAQAHRLPEGIIDVIQQHHGNSLVYYFFHAEMEKCKNSPEVFLEENLFRYPGSIPSFRESAIIMIADSLEAAYKSLDEIHEESITVLVENIVNDKIQHHQFDNSLLTFQEIELIKKAMIRALVATGHSRIKYPEKKLITLATEIT